MEWPARSPYLTPLDSFLWERVKMKFTQRQSSEHLIQQINTTFDRLELNREEIRKATRSVTTRCRKYWSYGGTFWEQLVFYVFIHFLLLRAILILKKLFIFIKKRFLFFNFFVFFSNNLLSFFLFHFLFTFYSSFHSPTIIDLNNTIQNIVKHSQSESSALICALNQSW